METLTIRQAYDAMFCFLEHWYRLTKADAIGALLSNMQLLRLVGPTTGEQSTADPAMWDDWMTCVQSVLFPDTPENRQLLVELVAAQENLLGTVEGSQWYARLLPDGRQVWAVARNGMIQYGGIREHPKAFNPLTGLSSPDNP
jgi:hypothetical protein